MKIATNPVYILPYNLKEAAKKLPAPEASSAVARIPGEANAAAIFRVPLQGVQTPAAGSPVDKRVELLRIVSKAVAEHIGPKAKMANAVLWLSVDAKRLHDRWHDSDLAGSQRLVEAGRLTGDVLETLGMAPGLSLAGEAATPIYFLADLGESFEQGQVVLSPADLADYAGVDDAGLLRLPELLQ